MNITKLCTTLAVTLLSAAANAAPVNLVVNGSFENLAQPQADKTWSYRDTLDGWLSDSTFSNKFEVRNNYAGTAQDGKNYVELDTTRNSNIHQMITSTGLNTLSFYYMNRPGTSVATNGLNFAFGLSTPIAIASATAWTKYTTTIDFGTGSTQKLTFAALGTSNSYGTSLDNISVSAIPEPETYAMMLAGLGLMGLIARRRRIATA